MSSHKRATKQKPTAKGKPSADSFERLLQSMDQVIFTCDQVLASSDMSHALLSLQRAKQSYGKLLRQALRFSMDAEQCRELESRTVSLEQRISRLESRVRTRGAITESADPQKSSD
jgi:hypothetical protein